MLFQRKKNNRWKRKKVLKKIFKYPPTPIVPNKNIKLSQSFNYLYCVYSILQIMEQIKTIQASGIGLKHEVLEDLYQNLLTAADVNKDGKISIDEYRDILPHDFRDEL